MIFGLKMWFCDVGWCWIFEKIGKYFGQVVYLAVQDFLQKREREKFEKEEEAKKKKGGKKAKVRARTGPRGFGQKIEEDDDDWIQV